MFDWLLGKRKIGLVLGGGVARGIAHVGVLKVFEKFQIPIHSIAATSSGALVGSAFAAGLEVRLIEEIALRISWGKILKISFFRPGFATGDAIQELIIKYIGDKKFSDLNLYLKGFEIESIGNHAVRKVQEENRKKGIPLVYSVDGKIYYELADGTVTTSSPFKEDKG